MYSVYLLDLFHPSLPNCVCKSSFHLYEVGNQRIYITHVFRGLTSKKVLNSTLRSSRHVLALFFASFLLPTANKIFKKLLFLHPNNFYNFINYSIIFRNKFFNELSHFFQTMIFLLCKTISAFCEFCRSLELNWLLFSQQNTMQSYSNKTKLAFMAIILQFGKKCSKNMKHCPTYNTRMIDQNFFFNLKK